MTDKPEWEYAGHQACKTEIERLRALLWANHGHDGLYGDDGEMQCAMHGSYCDFKRGTLDQIEAHLNPLAQLKS